MPDEEEPGAVGQEYSPVLEDEARPDVSAWQQQVESLEGGPRAPSDAASEHPVGGFVDTPPASPPPMACPLEEPAG